jgi:hypothetical protein
MQQGRNRINSFFLVVLAVVISFTAFVHSLLNSELGSVEIASLSGFFSELLHAVTRHTFLT